MTLPPLPEDSSPALRPKCGQRARVCCHRHKRWSLPAFSFFPGAVTMVYIMAEATCLVERPLLGRHVASTWTEWGPVERERETRREVMSNTLKPRAAERESTESGAGRTERHQEGRVRTVLVSDTTKHVTSLAVGCYLRFAT